MPLYLLKPKRLRLLVVCVVAVVYLYCIVTYLHQYYIHGQQHRPWYRDYGFKELIRFLENKNEYDLVYVTKATPGPYIQFLFYMKLDPKLYHQTNSVRDDDYKGFGRYVFVPDDCPDPFLYEKRGVLSENSDLKLLLVAAGNCVVPPSVREFNVIYRPDGTPIFRIWEENSQLSNEIIQ